MIFEDRKEAGKLLADKLKGKGVDLVLAIPRGGLEVGFQIAKELGILLDIVVTKKIGDPGNTELAIGAVGLDSVFLNDIAGLYGISEDYIEKETKRLQKEIKERYEKYGGGNIKLEGKVVVITDDGVATGATIIAAIQYVKKEAGKIIVALPICPPETLEKIRPMVDDIVCLSTELHMGAVGACYKYFPQISDEQAVKYLKEANKYLL